MVLPTTWDMLQLIRGSLPQDVEGFPSRYDSLKIHVFPKTRDLLAILICKLILKKERAVRGIHRGGPFIIYVIKIVLLVTLYI